MRALCEVLRQEIGPEIRATMVCPGATATEFTTDPVLREKMAAIAMEPGAVGQALAQPPEIDVGEIVVRSAAQPYSGAPQRLRRNPIVKVATSAKQRKCSAEMPSVAGSGGCG